MITHIFVILRTKKNAIRLFMQKERGEEFTVKGTSPDYCTIHSSLAE